MSDVRTAITFAPAQIGSSVVGLKGGADKTVVTRFSGCRAYTSESVIHFNSP